MSASRSAFESLDPNTFLQVIEEASGKKLTSICRPYTSYINRVFELQTLEGESLVAKFYRPGRWSEAAIQEEHDFLLELREAEIPVIAPFPLRNGQTLGSVGKIFFALFPKMGGRTRDELTDEEWISVGRLVGRTHSVGAVHPAASRVIWTPNQVAHSQIDFLLRGDFIPDQLRKTFETAALGFAQEAAPLFEKTTLLRIHGDLHYANLICRGDDTFFLIDFDDMAMGPAVQDVWMLLPGTRDETLREVELFIEGYETFRHFPRAELGLVEALRGMRFIHYSAWCAHQVADGSFGDERGDWGSERYWRELVTDLEKQTELLGQ